MQPIVIFDEDSKDRDKYFLLLNRAPRIHRMALCVECVRMRYTRIRIRRIRRIHSLHISNTQNTSIKCIL